MPISAGNRGLQLHNMDELWRFAAAVTKAGMAPRTLNSTEKVFIALQMGAELGLSPMQSLKNIAVVNNSPAMWGDALIALVRRSPVCKSIGEPKYTGSGETRVCTITAERSNGDTQTATFGYADAKRGGLAAKETYKSWPDRMYKHRAFGYIAHDLFADVLMGIDIAEEAQDLEYAQAKPTLASGDDAPLNTLDDAAELLDSDATDAVYEVSPSDPTPEELADYEREQLEPGQLFAAGKQYE